MRRKQSLSAISILLSSTAAFAQPAATNDSTAGLEEVVVTAQHRAESSQKASVALDVVSGADLETAGVTEPTGLMNLVSGMQIGMGGSALQIYIRGVGDFGSTAISNPSVAVNIDGVYQARTQSVPGSMFDLDRVEVLKGPQGTLYGRNASGGAINIIPAAPALDSYSGYAKVTGQNYDGATGEAAVNVPLTNTLAIRAGVQVTHRDGYMSDGSDDDVHESGRIQALYQPSDDFSLKLWGSYNHMGGEGAGYALLNPYGAGISGPSNLSNPWTAVDGPAGNAIVAAFRAAVLPKLPPPFGQFLDLYDPSSIYQDNDVYNVHAQLDWNLGWSTLTIIPAYQHAELSYHTVPAVPYTSVTFDGTPESSGTKSLETRLAGSALGLQWVGGFYYYDEDQTDTDSLQQGAAQRTYVKAKGTTEAYAGFGQVTYSLIDSVRLLGGIRYTHEQKTLDGMDYDGAPSLNCPVGVIAEVGPAGGCAAFAINGRYGADKTNYRAGFEYDAAPESMLFATVATGFKSGGLSYSNLPPYRAEELTAYTIGSKNRFLGNRLQLNGELFYWDYDNHQESLITQIQGLEGLTSTQTFINAGRATTKGASLDLTARVTNADKIRLSTEYAQSAYKSFRYQQYAAFTSTGCPASVAPGSLPPGQYGPLLNVDCSGRQLTHAPKWSGNAQVAHDFALADGSAVIATADVTYATARWLSGDFIANSRAPAYASLSLDAAYHPDASNITLDVFVRNVNNATIYAGGLQATFVPNLFAASLGAPRTYGGSLRYDF